ncbi:nucleotidyl transferase AbiEii/AbiGii toxin family protein [Flavobacterium sp.]|uniref:nucleotidyl transferase AbiEii/AbiGii toxin family protein n=1 Tax=Flavobacterium sp. TaxID=239 RepID=UPI0026168D34|nr:nucleotidyl transferase AbiEii/AbiGii toxin family protein [Flavobacterium sp.]MDG2432321.1 nucleotidyl transferase AbiEii/AbiGii toxin family protein [Flavobacterium sp.]
MSSYNPTYKDFSFAHHGDVYRIMETLFAELQIAYYLVGANARDVQLYKAGIKPSRGTADIDFAIMVPDFDGYNSILERLCTLGFSKTAENYRLYFDQTNTIIDFMPYGAIEQDYTVNFIEREISLSVLGFKEVGEKAELFTPTEESYSIPVSPVEGILILKLVAWSDKPETRTKDLEDIATLLKHAWDFYETEAYEHHLDLFDADFEQNKTAARIIGRKMKPILEQNQKLKQTIITILTESIQPKKRAQNPEITLAKNMDKTIEEVTAILELILKGIND